MPSSAIKCIFQGKHLCQSHFGSCVRSETEGIFRHRNLLLEEKQDKAKRLYYLGILLDFLDQPLAREILITDAGVFVRETAYGRSIVS